MNSRERLHRAIQFQQPDRPPVSHAVLPAAQINYGAALNELLAEFREDFGWDTMTDLAFVKERYFGRLCPIGNVDNKGVMTTGTPEDVRRETLECLRIGMPGGGYIISTDHSIHDAMPFDNIIAYLETAKEFGSYRNT
jgi:uroporphyrinogen-III decarboxylase